MSPTLAWFDGRVVPFESATVPLEDRGLLFGESLYEVLPVCAGRVRLLAEHIARMRTCASALELADGVPDDATWERLAASLVAGNGIDEGLLYAQLTGGVAPRLHVPTSRPRPTFWAYLRPFRFPRAEEAARGVRVIVADDRRWAGSHLKTTMLLPAVLAKREAQRHGASEALLIDERGNVREGASSNLFIVDGRTLVTPPQDRHVLPGITRDRLAPLAEEAGLEFRREPIPLERLRGAREAFLASTSLLAMPIVAVEDAPIGDGAAGEITLDLAARLRRVLEIA